MEQRGPARDVERIHGAIRNLGEQPRPHGVLKLKGSVEGYKIRTGDYRIMYEIFDEAMKIVISRVVRRTETTYRV